MTDDGHMTDFDRFGRITASVVPAILRSSKQSRKWAWRVITGREPVHGYVGHDIVRGLEHEEDAVAAVEVQLAALALPGRFVCHGSIDWLGASPDGFIVERVRIGRKYTDYQIPIEAKCPRELHVEIPEMYYDQVQTQIECCNVPYAYFVSWTGEAQRVIKVVRDHGWWARNLPILQEFYEEFVVKDVEPPNSKRRTKQKEANDGTEDTESNDGERLTGVQVGEQGSILP